MDEDTNKKKSGVNYPGLGLIIGAAIGTAVGGPIGTAIGAGIGLVIGAAIAANMQKKKE